MDRHVKDPYVNLTLGCGLRSRSAIKLLEAYQKFSQKNNVHVKKNKRKRDTSRDIEEGKEVSSKDIYQSKNKEEKQSYRNMIGKGFNVIDLGCNPGGWTQICHAIVGPYGNVFGIDMLPMKMEDIYNYDLPFDIDNANNAYNHRGIQNKKQLNSKYSGGNFNFDIKD